MSDTTITSQQSRIINTMGYVIVEATEALAVTLSERGALDEALTEKLADIAYAVSALSIVMARASGELTEDALANLPDDVKKLNQAVDMVERDAGLDELFSMYPEAPTDVVDQGEAGA